MSLFSGLLDQRSWQHCCGRAPRGSAAARLPIRRERGFGVLREYAGQPLALDAVLEAERAHHRVDLVLAHAPEELRVLGEQGLREQDVPEEKRYLPFGPEQERIVARVLLCEELLQRPHDVPDIGVRPPQASTPSLAFFSVIGLMRSVQDESGAA